MTTTPTALGLEFNLFAQPASGPSRVIATVNGTIGAATMWPDATDAASGVFISIADATGSLFPAEFHDNGAIKTERPAFTALADANAAYVYFDASYHLILYVSDADGFNKTDLGIHFTAHDVGITQLSDGNLAIMWEFGGHYEIGIYGQDGTTILGPVVRNPAPNPSGYSRPEIVALANGGFVVVATSSTNANDTVFAVFDNTRAEVATGVIQATAGSQTDAFVFALRNGGFVSVFTDENSGDGSGHGILFAVHDSTGVRVGSTAAFPLIANTVTTGNQKNAAGAGLSDGGFVLVWQDDNAGNGDIRAQVFNSDGAKRGTQFDVATGTNAQTMPSVAEMPDGRLVFSWDDELLGIRGRIFDPREKGITLNGTLYNDQYIGSDYSDTLRGQAGDDILAGGASADTLEGGTGNDSYLVDGLDTVVEAAGAAGGIDTIFAADTVVDLMAVQFGSGNVENATAIGNGNFLGTNGANVLDGESLASGFANILTGRAGADTYVVSTGDIVLETTSASGGVDTVRSATISLVLANYAGVENATLTGSAGLNLTGNAGANVLTGNSGTNSLVGGRGRDTMTGGGPVGVQDVFDFNAVNEMGKTPATRDRILDFRHLVDDIDLSTIDANGAAAGSPLFKFVAAKGAAFTGVKGQLIWSQTNAPGTANDFTLVQGDINGDRIVDFQIELKGLVTLTSADFFL